MWLLCGLGSAVFAASVRGWRDVFLFAAALVASVILLRGQPLPEPGWIGGISAVVAGWRLLRARIEPALPFLAGVLAGVAMLSLHAQEVPASLSVLATVPAIAAATLAFRKPSFAPEGLREEALLLVIGLGLVTALAPGIAAGWQAATGLNLKDNEQLRPAIPVWVLWTAALSALAGGAFTVWRRS